MTKARTYKSDVFAAIHETVSGMYASGVINKKTMRRFDVSCLTPVRNFSPAEIRGLREREGASQTIFAHYLNVTTTSVSQWEHGRKKPSGTTLKLLSLIERGGLAAIA